MELRRADWVLAADQVSIREARSRVAQRLDGLSGDSLEIILVLTSELVTNAILHGAGPLGLSVAWDDRGVRIDVHDESPERPVVRAVDHEAAHGRGLLLVDALADEWGVDGTDTGKSVWFTLRP